MADCCVSGLLTFSLAARAEEPIVPRGGWFGGLGGSFNSVEFDEDLFARGIGDVFSGTTLVATGAAWSCQSPPRHRVELGAGGATGLLLAL